MVKRMRQGEDPLISYWTSVVRSLIWKEESKVHNVDFILDPDGIAQSIINFAVQVELKKFKPLPDRLQFTKETNMVMFEIISNFQRLNVRKMWQTLAKNVKACFIESRLA